VRAPESAAVGNAQLTISFDSWKEGNIAPTGMEVSILPAIPKSPLKPVSTRLRATLSGGDKSANWALGFAPDGKTVAAADAEDGVIRLWDETTGQQRSKIAVEDSQVYALAFSPDGRTLATAQWHHSSTRTQEKGKPVFLFEYRGDVRLWDIATGKVRATLQQTPSRAVSRMAMSPDGRLIAAIGHWAEAGGRQQESQVSLWDVATAKVQTAITTDCQVVDFAPDSKTLVTAGKSVQLWDATSGKAVATLPMGEGPMTVTSVAFSPDGRTLAGGNHVDKLRLWDLPKRSLKNVLSLGKRRIGAVAFSPDGRTLAAAVNEDSDRSAEVTGDYGQPQIMLWDAATIQQRATLIGPPGYLVSLAYSPDGATLASGGIGVVYLWNMVHKSADD
jgi:WD40 repeat protein